MHISPINIADYKVGSGHPCFVIAEAGVNHNGSLERACQMISVAAKAGADAVKFQTFSADRLVTANAPKAAYQSETTGTGSQYDMLKKLELNAAAHRTLVETAKAEGIIFLSSPFDEDSADLLEELDVPAFKVGSGELTNTALIQHIAEKKRPVILSTGMAEMSEIEIAVNIFRTAGNPELALLHCVSAYPADPADANLLAMRSLAHHFALPVGYSDHTIGIETPLAAVALGACIIEKHFTLDRSLPGPDHRASATPDELQTLIKGIRTVESALGDGIKQPQKQEKKLALIARKSLHFAKNLPKGAILQAVDLTAMRPGNGIPPGELPEIIGRKLKHPVRKYQIIKPSDLL